MANRITLPTGQEIGELDVIGETVYPSLPCGTVVAYDDDRALYIYDPNFAMSGSSHYIRSSTGSIMWIAIKRDFSFIEACQKIGR